MKRITAFLLSCLLLLSGCTAVASVSPIAENTSVSSEIQTSTVLETTITTEQSTTQVAIISIPHSPYDTASEEYIETLGFNSLDDPNLMQFMNDRIYSELDNNFASDDYIIENISSIYLSKEYIEELDYNSNENVYFGYTLSELDAQFQGEKYIFTLGEDGKTIVKAFEEYDYTYENSLKRIAIGSGVMLFCVTVSVATAGIGAAPISVIFATSAKTAATMALSTGVISGVSSGILTGFETHNWDDALKAAADNGSKGFMWGAITGAIVGGASELITIRHPGSTPDWRQSEEYVYQTYSGSEEQMAFYNGKEVDIYFKNSTRPDVIRPFNDSFEAIEVKNYDLKNNLSNLSNTLFKQVSDRIQHLPSNYTQRIVLDTRNRGYTEEFLYEVSSYLHTNLDSVYKDIPIDIITNIGSKVYTIAA